MRTSISLAALGAVVVSLAYVAGASPQPAGTQDPPAARYVGVKGCKKCHQKSSIGKQYKVWSEMKHAKAFELLKSEEAAKVAAKVGIKGKAYEAPECLKCHTTGHGLPKESYGEKFLIEQGVTCEACHGPGEFFSKPEDKKTHKEALGKGYLKPDEKLCRSCHNEDSPTWKPDRDKDKDGKPVGFDFESRLKQIAHPIPKQE
jgi:hypothetical protein